MNVTNNHTMKKYEGRVERAPHVLHLIIRLRWVVIFKSHCWSGRSDSENSRIRDTLSHLPGVVRPGLAARRRLHAFGRSNQEEPKKKETLREKGTPKNTQWKLKAVDVSTNWRHLNSETFRPKEMSFCKTCVSERNVSCVVLWNVSYRNNESK